MSLFKNFLIQNLPFKSLEVIVSGLSKPETVL